jgi:hypothetical protein
VVFEVDADGVLHDLDHLERVAVDAFVEVVLVGLEVSQLHCEQVLPLLKLRLELPVIDADVFATERFEELGEEELEVGVGAFYQVVVAMFCHWVVSVCEVNSLSVHLPIIAMLI